jgi:sec-independent protein translocase protein TatA
MFGLGIPELILIFVIALVVFGPKKLPELGKSIGRAMAEFKKASEEFQESVRSEMKEVEKSADLEKVKKLAELDDLSRGIETEGGKPAAEQTPEQKTGQEPEKKQGEEAKGNG